MERQVFQESLVHDQKGVSRDQWDQLDPKVQQDHGDVMVGVENLELRVRVVDLDPQENKDPEVQQGQLDLQGQVVKQEAQEREESVDQLVCKVNVELVAKQEKMEQQVRLFVTCHTLIDNKKRSLACPDYFSANMFIYLIFCLYVIQSFL